MRTMLFVPGFFLLFSGLLIFGQTFLRNDTLDATLYSFTTNQQAKSPFKWNNFGFEMGPVRFPKQFNGQNRLFFMAN